MYENPLLSQIMCAALVHSTVLSWLGKVLTARSVYIPEFTGPLNEAYSCEYLTRFVTHTHLRYASTDRIPRPVTSSFRALAGAYNITDRWSCAIRRSLQPDKPCSRCGVPCKVTTLETHRHPGFPNEAYFPFASISSEGLCHFRHELSILY